MLWSSCISKGINWDCGNRVDTSAWISITFAQLCSFQKQSWASWASWVGISWTQCWHPSLLICQVRCQFVHDLRSKHNRYKQSYYNHTDGKAQGQDDQVHFRYCHCRIASAAQKAIASQCVPLSAALSCSSSWRERKCTFAPQSQTSNRTS